MGERVEQQQDDENTFKNISCFLLEWNFSPKSYSIPFHPSKEVYADSILKTGDSEKFVSRLKYIAPSF